MRSCERSLAAALRAADVRRPGLLTTVQDLPGRQGMWEVGVPPSGPMDDRSFARATAMVGNPPGAAGLEITLDGPTLAFPGGAVVAVCGAPFALRLDGRDVPFDAPLHVPPGGELEVGAIGEHGVRCYLAVRGGIDVPLEHGSRATFLAGAIGGLERRALRTGDRLELGAAPDGTDVAQVAGGDAALAPPPRVGGGWELRVVHGPHGAPDYLAPAGLEALLDADWEVDPLSDRAGVRLRPAAGTTPPDVAFARPDGGDAGLDPSNVTETPYAVGAIMLSGATPIVVGPDGPSLGGFTGVLCVTRADRWKLGQLRPGAGVRLRPARLTGVPGEDAPGDAAAADAGVGPIRASRRPRHVVAADAPGPARLLEVAGDGDGATDGSPDVRYRAAGQEDVVVEYGEATIDLAPRFRIHELQRRLRERGLPGLRDLTPGLRCLQVRRDPDRLPLHRLLDALQEIEAELPATADIVVPSREVVLPLAWEHPTVVEAMHRYQRSVRPDAPWCPDNVEFIRRINGLGSTEAVQETILAASYVVVGLGDVYLGAPVALPMDPRHQLVTTKYTPPRTWTPENAVGIGGAFLCVYGMEGPGGYQLFGRTVPVWARRPAEGEAPQRLRHFDRLRFELVDDEQLARLRTRAHDGENVMTITDGELRLADHLALRDAHADEIGAVRERRAAAFDAERERWAA